MRIEQSHRYSDFTSNLEGSNTYDANGNTLSDAQGRSFTWDFENRLVQAVVSGTNGGATTFRYDPFGRRIQKSGPLGSTNYLYDQDSLIVELNTAGNVLARYTQGTNIDEPMAEWFSAASYYDADGLGSITSAGDSSSSIVATYIYDSFGSPLSSTGTIANPFRYGSRELDAETGLDFYRARYFDPSQGRFNSQDPLGFGGGINFYRYVDNNPVVYVDPFGLTCHCTYHQRSGAIQCTSDDTGVNVVSATGYSGNGPGYNNPDQQNHKYYPGVAGSWGGPIPVGSYGIGPPTTAKGPLSLPLTPLPGTNTFGRDGFLIHGDNSDLNHSASEGCIVLNHDARQKIANCQGGTVQVVQ